MALFLWIILPFCWALAGKLAGLALAASCFFSDSGKRLGRTASAWCVPLLPAVYLLAVLAGVRGNAGQGFQRFGSETWFALACGVPMYAIPVLGLYAGVLYVVRSAKGQFPQVFGTHPFSDKSNLVYGLSALAV